MDLRAVLEESDQLSLAMGGRSFVSRLDVQLANVPELEPCPAGWQLQRRPEAGSEMAIREYLVAGDPVLRLAVVSQGEAVKVEVQLLRSVQGLAMGDAFIKPCMLAPWFGFSSDLRFLACTYGLDGGAGYPGGYWPTVVLGQGPDDLPTHALGPLVLFDDEGAVAIAPADFFLTSALVPTPGGAGRGLHGRINQLPAGTRLSTWFVAGKDPFHALHKLGDRLLARAGKSRGTHADHPLFSRLGYWNAYGSYYSEPLHPLDGEILQSLAASFAKAKLPVGYFGLDLWYPYETIGRANVFRPDPRKYPAGLKRILQKAKIPYVLHLSALAEENAYGASGAEPEVYRVIAEDAKAEGAVGVWHDWLRTWQHITPKLRKDPWAAERWFCGMAQAFAEQGLPVVLCMQTMGMVLASTQELNVVASRSHTDFLFAQQGALKKAARKDPGFLREAIRPHRLWAQNLLMGAVLWTLGLRPFHDLFLTRRHPGFGGEHPAEDALLRALSCGPVGFGDKLGLADPGLLGRLLLGDGRLAQPDHPPIPDPKTLGQDVQLFWTHRLAGHTRWLYLLALNTGDAEVWVPFDPPYPGDWLVWDILDRKVAPSDRGLVPGQGLRAFLLAPRRGGVAPVGFRDLFVPAPARGLLFAHGERNWELELGGVVDPLLFVGRIGRVRGLDGQKVEVVRRGDVALCRVGRPGRIVVERR